MLHTKGKFIAKHGRVLLKNSPFQKTERHPEFVIAQCAIYCGQGFGTLPDEESESNAILFASAPDLLNSLKDMVRIFDRGLAEGTIGYKACMEAKEAIKKATT